MKVVLIQACPTVLGTMSKESQEHAFSYLKGLEVEVMVDTKVKDYNGKVVSLEGGEKLGTDTLLWAAGIKPNKIAEFPDEK